MELTPALGDGTLANYSIYSSAVALNYSGVRGSTIAVSAHGAFNVSTNDSASLPLALVPGVYELNESEGRVVFSRIG